MLNVVIAIVIGLAVGFGLGTYYGSRLKADALKELQNLRDAAASAIKGKS